ncbi:hypothetical protein Pelo_5056 [Pelomyxa schiedti]|nr:hypothetical protein Pelo_5056 [Pelomyxa schiedti]
MSQNLLRPEELPRGTPVGTSRKGPKAKPRSKATTSETKKPWWHHETPFASFLRRIARRAKSSRQNAQKPPSSLLFIPVPTVRAIHHFVAGKPASEFQPEEAEAVTEAETETEEGEPTSSYQFKEPTVNATNDLTAKMQLLALACASLARCGVNSPAKEVAERPSLIQYMWCDIIMMGIRRSYVFNIARSDKKLKIGPTGSLLCFQFTVSDFLDSLMSPVAPECGVYSGHTPVWLGRFIPMHMYGQNWYFAGNGTQRNSYTKSIRWWKNRLYATNSKFLAMCGTKESGGYARWHLPILTLQNLQKIETLEEKIFDLFRGNLSHCPKQPRVSVALPSHGHVLCVKYSKYFPDEVVVTMLDEDKEKPTLLIMAVNMEDTYSKKSLCLVKTSCALPTGQHRKDGTALDIVPMRTKTGDRFFIFLTWNRIHEAVDHTLFSVTQGGDSANLFLTKRSANLGQVNESQFFLVSCGDSTVCELWDCRTAGAIFCIQTYAFTNVLLNQDLPHMSWDTCHIKDGFIFLVAQRLVSVLHAATGSLLLTAEIPRSRGIPWHDSNSEPFTQLDAYWAKKDPEPKTLAPAGRT